MANHPRYNNEEYKNLITEFFGEIFYLPGLSYGTKVQKLRQYTEIILRRLLNYRCDKNIELGNEYTLDNLDRAGFTEPLFRDSLEKIRVCVLQENATKCGSKISAKRRRRHCAVLPRNYLRPFLKVFWPVIVPPSQRMSTAAR